MKARLIVLAVFLLLSLPIFGNGVLLSGDTNSQYYQLLNSEVSVDVEDQVAVVCSKQEFVNQYSTNTPKYVFPLPEGASATQLRWFYHREWHTASFAPVAQDSLPPNPSAGWPLSLLEYMGGNPLFFNIEHPVDENESIMVELTYVMLLPYAGGSVTFEHQNNYYLLQTTPLNSITLEFQLSSQRTITGIILQGLSGQISNSGHEAQVSYNVTNAVNETDFVVVYSLDPEQFGLFSLSTRLDEVPDQEPNGFFLFIAEPDPSDNQMVIDKTFTLVIDRSGSMGGNKIGEAKNAANYIVDHLNPNDMFNIVSFASDVSSFWPQHVVASLSNRNSAHNYINTISANGGTNISGAFSTAVPQFNSANPNNANIIIFLTDGEATVGITNTDGLRQHVSNLFAAVQYDINLFNFGIGTSYSEQLLTLLARDHNGVAVFLRDNDLETTVTSFYNLIANPVMLNPVIDFSALAGITEVYPDPLPNVYQGSQLLVSGRYFQGGDTGISLTGQNYSSIVTYDYSMDLADSLVSSKQFLCKIWAKLKIEYLLAMYFSHPENSAEAAAYRQQIIDVSLAYAVMSPFTSFTGGEPADPDDPDDPGGEIANDDVANIPEATPAYSLRGNFPNPFNPSTIISFAVNTELKKLVKVRIYNLRGQVIKVLALKVDGRGSYEIVWDGTDRQGISMPSAVYFYVIDFGDAQLSGRMVMSK